MFASLDQLSGGRVSWNVVTSLNDAEARNFGVDQHLEHDSRYDRADEFLEAVHNSSRCRFFFFCTRSALLKHLDTITEYTRKIAMELNVVGLMNIQYAIANDAVYVLEANPRASRTVPLVSKVCNIPMARVATQVMLGKKLGELGLKAKHIAHYGVKEAVFPFNMFPEVDPVLGPEMKSTGEVLGMADSFGLAYYKAQEAALQRLPTSGSVLFTISDPDKDEAVQVAARFEKLGFNPGYARHLPVLD